MSAIWQTITLSAGDLELVILPGIGGRLWDVVFAGRSLLFGNPDLVGRVPNLDDLTDLPTKSPQFKFPLWGGEKTWIAPDSAWVNHAPFPVLDSGPYSVKARDDRQITLQSAVCPLSGLEIERRITLNDANGWRLHHKVKNRGTSQRLTGIWSVLMLDHPTRIGLEVGRQPQITPVFGDAAGLYELPAPFALFDCSAAGEFKLGTRNPAGRVFMKLGDGRDAVWLSSSTASPARNDRFAHGHEFEIFNSGDYPYCEAEWHAPQKNLKPGESCVFDQTFRIWSASQQALDSRLTPSEQELVTCMSS